ncbi:hypothetical protein PRIPAC_92496 [Pristionchus pacificus]|uniref:Uncharacterized protein n=1 Tax=Pristionchus pacificus TaxID=54126 RepID=A0A2A6CIP1_PRIPA|nr:hypothetical protein PRIPAC_92496 [Pristionchus pacificus]|eukprot:PDM77923.1 hypothetical protein PRIPAC_34790 [Pristionchus pacificus]
MNDSERLDMIETWRKKAYQNSHSDLLCRLQTGLFEIMQAMISTDPHSQYPFDLRVGVVYPPTGCWPVADQLLTSTLTSCSRIRQQLVTNCENDEERALHYGMLTSVCQLFTFLSREGENGLSSPQSNMQNESSHSPLDTDIFNEVMESAARHAQKKKEVIARRNTFYANPKDLVKKKLMKTVNFDQSLLTSSKYDHKGVFDTLEPEEFTRKYYQSEGLEKVLIFDCKPEELGMK